MNHGESSSKTDKRSVSDENEEIVVSSDLFLLQDKMVKRKATKNGNAPGK
jgi:hypothetical protein